MLDFSAEDSRLGRILNDRYRIIDQIATGGMGIVYRAERIELGRLVAIKFLQTKLTSNKRFLSRFEGEARAMSKLNHPYCVPVIDYGVEGAPYIVMDYVTGKTLKTIMEKERLGIARSFRLARQLLAALSHAHGHGIIHRDIKPDNVMLCNATGLGEHVRIFDFGLAKLLDDSQESHHSTTSVVVGTPNYMSPEQTRGEKIDGRTDVYSTGVVIYEMLAGRKPFIEEDILAVLRMHREAIPPSLRVVDPDTNISEDLEAVIFTALAKNPKNRFQSPDEFIEALNRTPEGVAADSVEQSSANGMRTQNGKASTGRDEGFEDKDTQVYRSKNPQEKSNSLMSYKSKAVSLNKVNRSKRRTWPLFIVILAAIAGMVWYVFDNRLPFKVEQSLSAKESETTTDHEGEHKIDVEITPSEKIAIRETADQSSIAANPEKDDPEQTMDDDLEEVKALADSGKLDEALELLKKTKQKNPKNAHISFVMGQILFQKGSWADALDHYGMAIRLSSEYKERDTLVEDVISMLGNKKTKNRAREFIARKLGKASIPYLEKASNERPNPDVRSRAKNLVDRISNE